MIYIEQFCRDLILATDTLSEILGIRVYADHLPQNCILPAVSVSQVQPERSYTQSGQCNLITSNVNLTIYADTLVEIRDIAEQVRLLFSGYKGVVGSYTCGGIFIESETTIYDESNESYFDVIVLRIEGFEKSPGVTLLHYLTAMIAATGGTHIPTLGAAAIGVTGGPQTVGQAGWIELRDSEGNPCFIPVWR